MEEAPQGQVLRDRMLDRILKGAGITLAVQVAGAGLSYALQLVLARWLEPAGYGEYTYVMAWVALLAIPAGLGLGTAVMRFVPEYAAGKRWRLVRGVAVRSWQLTSSAGMLLAAVAGGLVLLFYSPAREGIVLAIGMAIVPLRALLNLQQEMGRSVGRAGVGYLPDRVARPLLIVGGLGLAAALGAELDSRSAVAMAGVAIALCVVVQGVVVWRSLPPEARAARPEFQTRRWLRVGLPLLLISGFLLLINRTDVIMLGLLMEAADVGVYNAAARTAAVVGFVLTAVTALAAPMISKLHARGEGRRLQELAGTVVTLAFWPSLVAAGGIVAFSEPILGLFGEEFLAARTVLTLLLVGQLANAGAGAVAYLMNMTGHEMDSARVFGAMAAINVVLNLVLIPPLGLEGAAVATSLSMVLWNLWLQRLVRRRLNVRSSLAASLTQIRGWLAKG